MIIFGWTSLNLKKFMALLPEKMIDLKALMGDSSDNIKGVKGIGEKNSYYFASDLWYLRRSLRKY